ncbi:MAG: amidohydrolase [Prevotella sp.]|uniref:amidohydrolase n=1 Tax=Prevotella sp. TaxID=59823 RepID=UPI002A258E37|nr:amidohydrolase [Prevotella sp.]MDD7318148.1 amidohydrolase [Prevotellaceae bacterium]MDY4020963.1 amidohydrolase [Prevotella sp.]
MKTTILQMDIAWGDNKGNVLRADAMIDDAPEADLYILPEMFSTGFTANPEGLVEGEDCKTLEWMYRKAKEKGAAIAGSIATKCGERFFNRLYFVKPDGDVVAYDKRHLFSYAGENLHYTRGEERVIVEWRGVRIMLQVCYDLRFPVFSRNHGDYDMLIYVASWPTSRIKVWDTLLHARALENQCYVAGVNRVGSDPKCEYCGNSVIISPYGDDIAVCESYEESAKVAEIDMEKLRSFRKKFPVMDDADIIHD